MNIEELLEYHKTTGKEIAEYVSDDGNCRVAIAYYDKWAVAGNMKNATFTIK